MKEASTLSTSSAASNRPLHEVRLGRIKVCIWANGNSGNSNSREKSDKAEPWYSVTVGRLYKEGEQWKTSESFGRDDILLVCKALDLAHTWTYQQAEAQ